MKLYHISRNSELKVLVPRVPKSTMTPDSAGVGHHLDKYTKENCTTKRVCFSESIAGCIKAKQGDICEFNHYYVYVYDDSKDEALYPTQNDVPDVNATKERWMMKPCKISCLGRIIIGQEHKRTTPWNGIFAGDDMYFSIGRRYRWMEKFSSHK